MPSTLPPALTNPMPACFAATLSRLLATTAAFWQASTTPADSREIQASTPRCISTCSS